MIVLVLIQRGKGGGLAGALGGMGGQSAFGTKAGDLFTKITIGVATFWIVLCIVCVIVLPKVTGPGRWGVGPRRRPRRSPPAGPATAPPPRRQTRPRRGPGRRRRASDAYPRENPSPCS